MYILKILVYPLEIYIIENRFFKTQNSLNPVYMNTSFAIKKSIVFFYNCKDTRQKLIDGYK